MAGTYQCCPCSATLLPTTGGAQGSSLCRFPCKEPGVFLQCRHGAEQGQHWPMSEFICRSSCKSMCRASTLSSCSGSFGKLCQRPCHH